MKRLARKLRGAIPSACVLAAGCAHYGDTSTSAYVMGTIFLLVGLALGVALIFSLNS
jgi:hypothetical protein